MMTPSTHFSLFVTFMLSISPLIFAQNNSAFFLNRNVTEIDILVTPSPIYVSPSITNLTQAPVTHRVSYFVDGDGLAVIDGDVIYGTEQEILAAAVNRPSRGKDKRSASIFPLSGDKWPGGVVYYKWYSAFDRSLRGSDFNQAVKRWTDRLPFLRFVEIAPPTATPVLGVITLKSEAGTQSCSSPIGMAKSAKANFMKLDACGIGTYAHEIGHTLGLYHEQMRPDRNAYLEIDCNQVMDKIKSGMFTKAVCDPPLACQGFGCNFRVLGINEADWAGPYDILSIMHYTAHAFSKGALPTLIGKPPIVLPAVHSSFPTMTDARRVCDIYWEVCRGVCGDGILSPNNGEECDDGNNIDGDGCSANCKKENVCGNGVREGSEEECDDGNTIDGDGCSSTCKIEKPPSGGGNCETCIPFPGQNKCDITTSCITIEGASGANVGKHYCACAHGFRGKDLDAKSVDQFRLPWASQKGRVFVKPGVACNQLCDGWLLGRDGCTEVNEQPKCY